MYAALARQPSLTKPKALAPQVVAIHCTLHHENLVAEQLHFVLDEAKRVVVQVVYHIMRDSPV